MQARVSATVGAVTRAQPSPTRPVANVIPVGTALSSPSPALTPNATIAQSTTSGQGATATAESGTATAALTTRTPLAGTATPLTGSVGATPSAAAGVVTPPASLGSYARLGGFSVTVGRYEWSSACPTAGGQAPPNTKFVAVHVTVRNDASAALALPPVEWTVGGHLPAPSDSCRPEGQALAEACPRVLTPEARCDGWLLFEVPAAMEIPGTTVQARSAGGVPDVARWRLPG